MWILLETYIGVTFFIILGLVFFWIFARILIGAGEREDKYQKLQSEISMAQFARRREHQKILFQIGKPECPDGTFSQRQIELWADYRMLDAQDQALTYHEHNALVEAQGYLPDEIADIIEGRR